MTGTQEAYERYLAERHRPAHGRRTAARWAAFLLPHLGAEMRMLDVGLRPRLACSATLWFTALGWAP